MKRPTCFDLSAALLIAHVSGCSAASDGGSGEEPTNLARQPLTGADCSEPGFKAVGYLRIDDEICTATRIRCGVLLTALHCWPVPEPSEVNDPGAGFQDGTQQSMFWPKFGVPIDHNWYPNPLYPDDAGYASQSRDLLVLFGVEEGGCKDIPVAALPDPASAPYDLTAVTAAGTGYYWDDATQDCSEPGKCRFLETSASGNGRTLAVTTSKINPGDSGGPLLLGHVEADKIQQPTILGVLSCGTGYGSAAPGCNPDDPHEPPGSGTLYFTNLLAPAKNGVRSPIQFVIDTLDEYDKDQDGIADPVDNCPGLANNDQTDSDQDGVGDGCDLCPCDPMEDDPWGHDWDEDGDGICGRCEWGSFAANKHGVCTPEYCAQQPVDSCPHVYSDESQNCNLDSELAMGARIMADACDPVPCPRFDSQEKSSSVTRKVPIGGASKGFEGYLYVEASSTGKLAMTPIGAHASPEMVTEKITDPALVLDDPVVVDSTEYRYCVDIPAKEVWCSARASINDAFLHKAQDRDAEIWQSVWHRIWIAELPKPSSTAGTQDPLDLDLNPYDHSTERTRIWRWEDDFAFWSTLSKWKTDVPYGVPSEAGQGKGALWVHANTTHGMDVANAAHGIHGLANDKTVPATGLANAFQEVSPIVTKSRYVIHKLLTRVPLNLDFTLRPCLACGIEVPEPGTLEHPDWGYPLAQVPGGSPLQAQQVVTLPGIDAPTVLLNDGSLMAVSGLIGQGLQASLAQGVRWADAVETDPAAGNGALAPSAIGLGSAGNTIVERLYVRSGALLGQEDVSPTHGPLTRVASASTMSTSAGPEPRTDPITVYSRSSRRLFLLGGRSSTSGELLPDVWWADVDSGDWERVQLKEFSLGSVIAATYSPRDRRLWILDEPGQGKNARARLSRLQPGTGVVEVLGEWSRTGKFDQHWLILDRDGRVLLAASSEKVNKHVVLRLDAVGGALQVVNSFAGQHALALRPLVDAEGYGFATRIAAHKMPVVVRLKALTGGIGHWGGIGACM